jgi:DUF917 family protein
MKLLEREDLLDILYGCTILGTGGGGALEKGIRRIEEALNLGKQFKLASLEEIPPNSYIACPYYCGAISPLTPEVEARYSNLPKVKEEPALLAFKALEDYMGKEFYGTISTELGGANTAIAFYVASMLGKCIVDADPAGRSVPELQHTTFYINNVPITPMAVVNEFGETAILLKVVDDFRAETLVRSLAIASRNSVAVADHPLEAKKLKGAVIPNAISFAWQMGKSFRKATREKGNKGEAVARAGNGHILFQGLVKEVKWSTEEGFTVGDTFIKSKDGKEEYHIWFKNENIVAWRNGIVDVTVPDLICVIVEDAEVPVTNPYLEAGMRVTVVGLPAPEEWKSEKALKVFGPKSFGFDFDYKPLPHK